VLCAGMLARVLARRLSAARRCDGFEGAGGTAPSVFNRCFIVLPPLAK
jgi:hypothetical protein